MATLNELVRQAVEGDLSSSQLSERKLVELAVRRKSRVSCPEAR